jgi:hypothetical protein
MSVCAIDGVSTCNNTSDSDTIIKYEGHSYIMPRASRYYQCDISQIPSILSSLCDRSYQLIVMDPVC